MEKELQDILYRLVNGNITRLEAQEKILLLVSVPFTINDAKEVVAAWEALEGGRNHSGRAIEKWLADYMKPAIDKLRSKIKNG